MCTWDNYVILLVSFVPTQLNSFQVVVASDSRQSFIIFNYNRLQWTTGDASGGRYGFGGTPARAGINGGYGVNAITLYPSGSRSLIYKTRDTNCGVNGVFVLAPSRTGKNILGQSIKQYTHASLCDSACRSVLSLHWQQSFVSQ